MAKGDPCKQCGRPVPASRRARPRLYCSEECRFKYNNTIRDRSKHYDKDKEYRQKNLDKLRKWQKAFRKRHRDRVAAAKQRWLKNNQDTHSFLRRLKRHGGVMTPETYEKFVRHNSGRRGPGKP